MHLPCTSDGRGTYGSLKGAGLFPGSEEAVEELHSAWGVKYWKKDWFLEERDHLWAILANCNLGREQSEIS